MSIVTSGPKAVFIPLTYKSKDAIDKNKYVYTYPAGYDFSIYSIFYIEYAGVIKTVSKYNVEILTNNKVRLNLGSVFGLVPYYAPAIVKILCDATNDFSLDFIDKYGQSGTIYTYKEFTLTNTALYNKLINTQITSEDLMFGFYNVCPLVQKHVTYLNGVPSPTLYFNTAYTVSNSYIAFFNNSYIGLTSVGGGVAGYNNSKQGQLEIISQGRLEFSLTMQGPWSKILTIPTILSGETKTCYVRTGEIISSPIRRLNSIKVFTTEVI